MLLVRHAESEGNRAACFTPHPEIPITPEGRMQAHAAAARLRAFAPARVVSSPYLRARQTAHILAEELALRTVHVEDDLRERSYGALAGLPYATPRPGFDPACYWDWRPPGGETLVEVVARAGAALDRVAAAAAADGHDVVVVSHGAVMLALVRHVTGRWGPSRVVPNVGLLVARHDGDAWCGLEVPT
ncbi:MAG: histidine phosphatase family protein [bacterium]|nr:histidine phosphatase family protein [bacterium]